MFIRSERLFLRPCWPEDRAELVSLREAGAATRDLAHDPIAVVLDAGRAEDRRSPRFLITTPGSGVIGVAAIGRGSNPSEISLWIARSCRNQGYATEAVGALVDVARILGHDRLSAAVFLGNRSAARVLERLGFVPSGSITPRHCPEYTRELPSTWFHRDLRMTATRAGSNRDKGAATLAA